MTCIKQLADPGGAGLSIPTDTSPRRLGASELRNIKAAFKNSFPYITDPVKVSQDDINYFVRNSSGFVKNMIVPFFGKVIPEGFRICDGQNGTPDLRNRFIKGATKEAANEYTGTDIITLSDYIVTSAIALDQTHIPLHNHSFYQSGANKQTGPYRDEGLVGPYAWDKQNEAELKNVSNPPQGSAHNHAVQGTFSIVPKHYKLVFIMYTGG